MKTRTILCSILLLVFIDTARTQQPAATASPAAAAATAAIPAPAAAAAAACQSYTKLDSAAAPSPASSPVVSTIVVPDGFKIGTVAVSDVHLAHSRIGALKISLVATPPPTDTDTSTETLASAVLKDVRAGSSGANLQATSFVDNATAEFPQEPTSAPFSGTWQPQDDLAAAFSVLPSASASWSLRVADLGDKRDGRTIQLTKWTLVLCPEVSEAEAAAAAAIIPSAGLTAMAESAADAVAAITEPATAAGPAADGAAAAEGTAVPSTEDITAPAAATTAAAAATTAAAADATAIPAVAASGDDVTVAAAAPAAASATSDGTTSTRGLGLLEELLTRINRAEPASGQAGAAAAAATPDSAAAAIATPGAAATVLSDDDATLVQRLMDRLTQLNGTATPGARAPVLGARGTIGGAASSTGANRSVWRLGNVTLNDSDGLVSNFLSSLSDVLYALADGNTTTAGAGGIAMPGAGLLASPPLTSLAADVTTMAQSAFRSLADRPATFSSLMPNGFRLDHSNKLIEMMPFGGNSIKKALTTSAGGLASAANVASRASSAMRSSLGAQVASAADYGNAMQGYARASTAGLAQYAAASSDLRQQLVEDQVAAYVRAVQTAASLTSSNLKSQADQIVTALEAMQAAARAVTSQLSGMRLLDGSAASALMGPAIKRINTAAEGMRSVANGMYKDAQNSVQTLLGAYKARVGALSNMASAGASAFTNVVGARYGMSMDTLAGAISRLSSGLDALEAKGGPLASQAAKVQKQGLDMMQASMSQFRSMLQSAEADSGLQMAADVRQRLGQMIAQMQDLQTRIDQFRKSMLLA